MTRVEKRPMLYDLSHLMARLLTSTGTGIDRIDLAFAAHYFVETELGKAVRYGSRIPRSLNRKWTLRFIEAAQAVWDRPKEIRRNDALWSWLQGSGHARVKLNVVSASIRARASWKRVALRCIGYFAGHVRHSVPPNAIYINVAYHCLERVPYFKWLEQRPDVDAVFMIHDLLPLDYPEYFKPDEALKFHDRIATALRFGRGFLVSTHAVEKRLREEIAKRNLEPRPIWVRAFPSPLAAFPAPPLRPLEHPYFLIIGTIEPRKNHLMLLQLWRAMVKRCTAPPRLVLVGARGWENEQVLDLLERCEILRPYIAEVADLDSRELVDLIRNARALLAPTFDEGYGLPVVEALTLGTPVVAADIDSIREIARGHARLISPIDGEGWRQEIERLASDDEYYCSARRLASAYSPPNWTDYFASLNQFLCSLRTGG